MGSHLSSTIHDNDQIENLPDRINSLLPLATLLENDP